MKTHWSVYYLVLTDQQGEWWDAVKEDDPTTPRMLRNNRCFPTEKQAINYTKHIKSACKVYRLDPPIKPSTTWKKRQVYKRDAL